MSAIACCVQHKLYWTLTHIYDTLNKYGFSAQNMYKCQVGRTSSTSFRRTCRLAGGHDVHWLSLLAKMAKGPRILKVQMASNCSILHEIFKHVSTRITDSNFSCSICSKFPSCQLPYRGFRAQRFYLKKSKFFRKRVFVFCKFCFVILPTRSGNCVLFFYTTRMVLESSFKLCTFKVASLKKLW